MYAHGKGAAGNSVDLMSSAATEGRTRESNHTNADFAKNGFREGKPNFVYVCITWG